MTDDAHDSFTKQVARLLGKRVGVESLNLDMVSRFIEDYAEDCTTADKAVDRILALVPPNLIPVMDWFMDH